MLVQPCGPNSNPRPNQNRKTDRNSNITLTGADPGFKKGGGPIQANGVDLDENVGGGDQTFHS